MEPAAVHHSAPLISRGLCRPIFSVFGCPNRPHPRERSIRHHLHHTDTISDPPSSPPQSRKEAAETVRADERHILLVGNCTRLLLAASDAPGTGAEYIGGGSGGLGCSLELLDTVPSRSVAEHMAEALHHHLPRRFVASTAASSSPSSQWVLSPASRIVPRRMRLAGGVPPGRPRRLKAHAAVGPETGEQPKWWERNASPNMIDIHSTQEFLDALRDAGDRLVIVEFYGTWCGSCRALFPRLCRAATENPNIVFLKVNFDENKPMCKRLSVKVLPFFHFYRGADGQLEAFSCSLAKFQKLKDAIAIHNTDRCSIGPAVGVGDVLDSPSPEATS